MMMAVIVSFAVGMIVGGWIVHTINNADNTQP